ncbi:UNVERIFIED_CONTAM: hypothetical protein K2H54_044346 [Gekko kuhli]
MRGGHALSRSLERDPRAESGLLFLALPGWVPFAVALQEGESLASLGRKRTRETNGCVLMFSLSSWHLAVLSKVNTDPSKLQISIGVLLCLETYKQEREAKGLHETIKATFI